LYKKDNTCINNTVGCECGMVMETTIETLIEEKQKMMEQAIKLNLWKQLAAQWALLDIEEKAQKTAKS